MALKRAITHFYADDCAIQRRFDLPDDRPGNAGLVALIFMS
jgi:hypothetical protein